jgi:hypothetical protein
MERRTRVWVAGMFCVLVVVTGQPAGAFTGAAPTVPSARSTTTAAHYLYAEEGQCPTDAVDVFRVSGRTLTPIQRVEVGGCRGTYAGTHRLAVVQPNSVHGPCLVMSGTGGSGMNSFAIDVTTGALSAVTSMGVGGYPDDVLVIGSRVFVSSPNGGTTIDAFSVVGGCTLRLAQASNIFPNERDINIAELTSTQIVSADIVTGNINTFDIGNHDVLTEVASVPGQLSYPQGVAVTRTGTSSGTVLNVYTGDYSTAEAQGFQATATGAMTPLVGSPQTSTDPTSSFGGAVLADRRHKLLLQANQGSHQISWYRTTVGTPGSPGTLTYGGDTTYPLGTVDTTPIEMAELGSTLFVATTEGDVQACNVANSGVSGCSSAATLPGYGSGNGDSGSVAIL